MAYFYMMVGLPGSGKTTFADILKLYFPGGVKISTDDIREELFGDASVQADNAKVFDLATNRVIENLGARKSVIFDATNISSKHRVSFLEKVKKASNDQHTYMAVVVCTDFEECCRRNKSRERVVPQEVLDRMVRSFQCPQQYEGFDHIIFVGREKSPEYSDIERGRAEEAMRGFDQKTPYHKYDLFTHCQKVAEQFGATDVRRVAGWVHDVGKMYTQKIDENGIAHYYGHESVSTYQLLCNKDYFPYADDDGKFLEMIFYVNNHMHIRDIIKSEKAIARYKKLWGEERFNKLVEFMKADNKASGREV